MSTGPHNDPGVELALRLRLACEAHELSIATHLDHVTHYACELARLAGFSEGQNFLLKYAAPLHDIGKIAVPHELLTKPGALTPDEMILVQSHTIVGHRILAESSWPIIQCAAHVALSHHENWDGSGYPHRLRGGEIPIEARVVAIADVCDALLSRRAYKPAWEESIVVNELRRLRGVKFDPHLLDLFLENLTQIEIHAA